MTIRTLQSRSRAAMHQASREYIRASVELTRREVREETAEEIREAIREVEGWELSRGNGAAEVANA